MTRHRHWTGAMRLFFVQYRNQHIMTTIVDQILRLLPAAQSAEVSRSLRASAGGSIIAVGDDDDGGEVNLNTDDLEAVLAKVPGLNDQQRATVLLALIKHKTSGGDLTMSASAPMDRTGLRPILSPVQACLANPVNRPLVQRAIAMMRRLGHNHPDLAKQVDLFKFDADTRSKSIESRMECKALLAQLHLLP